MSKTFKKGDTVRALDSNTGAFTKGKLYVVRQDYPGYPGDSVKIAEDDEGSTTNGWHEDFFELAEPRKYVVLYSDVYAIHPNREEAVAAAKRLAEKFAGFKYAVYEHATTFVADKPTAREV